MTTPDSSHKSIHFFGIPDQLGSQPKPQRKQTASPEAKIPSTKGFAGSFRLLNIVYSNNFAAFSGYRRVHLAVVLLHHQMPVKRGSSSRSWSRLGRRLQGLKSRGAHRTPWILRPERSSWLRILRSTAEAITHLRKAIC